MGTVGHEVSIGMYTLVNVHNAWIRITQDSYKSTVGHKILAVCYVYKGSDPDYVSVPERESCCETVKIKYRYGTGSQDL